MRSLSLPSPPAHSFASGSSFGARLERFPFRPSLVFTRKSLMLIFPICHCRLPVPLRMRYKASKQSSRPGQLLRHDSHDDHDVDNLPWPPREAKLERARIWSSSQKWRHSAWAPISFQLHHIAVNDAARRPLFRPPSIPPPGWC